MSANGSLRLAARLAWREMRSGLGGFGLFLACLALGVAAICAVGTLSASVRQGLEGDARRILGGDLEISQSYLPISPQAMTYLQSKGQVAQFARMRVMARAAGGRTYLAELKAVGPRWPLLGRAELAGGGDAATALARVDGHWGALVEPGLLGRLGIQVGDELELGKLTYRVRGVLASEPDRASEFFSLAPRLLVSLESLAATGLGGSGALVAYHYKVLLPPSEDLASLKSELQDRYAAPGWRVREFSQATRGLDRLLANTSGHLALVSLAALLVGGIGVAGAVRHYLAGRRDSIASLKCLGAERGLLLKVYLLQTLVMALLGSLIGLVAGIAAAAGLASMLGGALGLPVKVGLYAAPLGTALLYGLLTALAFSLPPISVAGGVSPARLFSGYTEPHPPQPTWAARLAALAAFGALFLLAWLTASQPRVAAGFGAAALLSAGLFWALAWLVKQLAARLPRPRDPRLLHALANLHRPGAATGGVIFSLGLGLTVLAGVALVEGNIQHQIQEQLPRAAPSYFLLDIPKDKMPELRRALLDLPGVNGLDSEPSLRGRIVSIGGSQADENKVKPDARWALRGDRGMTFAGAKPPDITLSAGQWWPADYQGPPLICFDQRMADGFGLKVGDSLTLSVLGRTITARIACLRTIDWTTMRLNHSIIFAPGVLENAPYTYIATVRADKEGEAAISSLMAKNFLQVVAVPTGDVLAEAGRVLGNLGLAVRATAGITLLAGLLVLAQAVRAGLRSRYYEAVVFKVFGATRGDVTLTLLAEFLFLGLAAALLAAFLGALLSAAFVTWIMRGPWVLLPWPLITVTGGGVLATVALGLSGVRGVLSQKAWPILRNE
jgi:putative ABC transport system permease protein